MEIMRVPSRPRWPVTLISSPTPIVSLFQPRAPLHVTELTGELSVYQLTSQFCHVKSVAQVRPVEIEGDLIAVQAQQIDRTPIDKHTQLIPRSTELDYPVVRSGAVVQAQHPFTGEAGRLRSCCAGYQGHQADSSCKE